MSNFEIAMKDFNIVNLMCVGFNDYEEFIDNKVKESEDYKTAEEAYKERMSNIEAKEGFKFMDELDNTVIVMEHTIKDIAFNEGFKMGVKFILDFIANGK